MKSARRCAAMTCLVTALVMAALPARPALADEAPPVAELVEMNKRALDDYQNRRWTNAKRRLLEAISRGKDAGVAEHPIMARTYLHLGAVYLTGWNNRAAALQWFAKALRLQPGIQVASAMNTEKIAGAFAEAQARASGDSGDEAGAAAELPIDVAALDCPNTDEVARNKQATIRCAVSVKLGVASVVLHYRSAGQASFTTVDMKKTAMGWYLGQIPKAVTGGSAVQFYIEAKGRDGKTIVASGSNGSPNLMLVSSDDDEGTAQTPAGVEEREENPLEGQPRREGTLRRSVNAADQPSGFPVRRWWLGLGFGSGYGYARGEGLQGRKDLQFESGLSWARIGQLSPELGVHLTPRLALAVQGRSQWVPGTGKAGGAMPAANAVLLHMRFFSAPQRLRVYGGPTAGFGEFRFTLSAETQSGTTNDSIKGGPFLVGAGLGVAYALAPAFSFIAETGALVGFSSISGVMDVNVGMQVNFY